MKKLISVFLCLLLVFAAAIPTMAADTATGEEVYFEDFEKGETDIMPTSEKTGKNEILSEDGNHYLHFYGYDENRYSLSSFGPYVADFDFEAKLRQTIHNGMWSYCMVLFHTDWNVNAYRADFFEDHARLAFDDGVNEEEIFGSYEDSGIASDKWYTVQIFGRGDEYTLVLDGKVVATVTSDKRDEGNFGFCGWQTEFDVDDVKITEYVDGTAPAVSTLVEGMEEEEEDNRDVIEEEEDNRTMEDDKIDNAQSSSLGKILLFASLGLAAAAVLVIGIILIVALIKKRKSKA